MVAPPRDPLLRLSLFQTALDAGWAEQDLGLWEGLSWRCSPCTVVSGCHAVLACCGSIPPLTTPIADCCPALAALQQPSLHAGLAAHASFSPASLMRLGCAGRTQLAWARCLPGIA